jgi:hypothetical protein
MTIPAYDVFHAAVRNGLIKDGWTITDDPLVIEFGTLDVYIRYDPELEALVQWIEQNDIAS